MLLIPVWLLRLQKAIPEGISAILTLSISLTTGDFSWGYPLNWLAYAVLLRVIWNSSLIMHGLGHTLAIAIVDRQLSTLTLTNILEHRSVTAVLGSLLPFQIIHLPGCDSQSVLWVSAGYPAVWRIRIKALGGIAFNLLSAAIMGWLFFNAFDNLLDSDQTAFTLTYLYTAGILAHLWIAACSGSDITALVTGTADRFYCGNFGLIAKRQPGDDGQLLLPPRLVNIAQQMGSETEIRGEQAGGGLVLARDGDRIVFVGKKTVNRKRNNLTQSLEAAFAPARQKAIAQGIQPTESGVTGVWHYRYGTSGAPPSELETHWHEWMGDRTVEVWQFHQGDWSCITKNVNHRITHNGDFDAWTLFEQVVDNVSLGLWLERVLHIPNATKGDSPKIAGVLDLLITQGMWDASVRLAYQWAIASGLKSAFGGQSPHRNAPNTAPSVTDLADWATLFADVFASQRQPLQLSDGDYPSESCSTLAAALIQATADHGTMAQWPEAKRVTFVQIAIQAFLYNDLYRATQLFMARAKGSFGLVTASTLDEDHLVLSAKGQPITIGFNWQQNYMVYASEPAAVDRVLLGVSGSSRFDLDQKTGEIAKVSADGLTVYSMCLSRELTLAELKHRWLSLKYHPYLPYLQFPETANSTDPVASDIQSIPQVLNQIKIAWQDPTSLNRQSADYLADWLTKKAQHFEQKQQTLFQAGFISQMRQMPTIDLLITGEENSLWVGERFAQDLKTVFPFLNVLAFSANQVLQQLNQGSSQLCLDRNSLILAITQSGQTFSTIQVINTFDHLCAQGTIGELFILTGELSSFINFVQGNGGLTAVFQPSSLENSSRHRIFVNGSGRRIAEPATVSVAAAGQTLTELLLYLSKQLRQRFPDSHPLGMTLTPESLVVLNIIKEDFLENTVTQITGMTTAGSPLSSAIRQKLIRAGQHWALHVTEAPLIWAIHALYVFISVGWAIPFGEKLPLAKTVFGLLISVASLPPGLVFAIAPFVSAIDIAIYIFGPWLWTLLLRYTQGRQLLARMGKRMLVIGDVSWVSQLLQSYVSKLFSLSYGIASIDVHSADPQNFLLHVYSHRVVRGTLILLGVPDGRRGKTQKAAENAVLMTGKQANGIRNMSAGPEIVAVGHNTEIASVGFSDAIILESRDDSIHFRNAAVIEQKDQINTLRESCFGASERLLASYVFFWALAKRVAAFPFLKYDYWKSQSRTKIMTTASPVAGISQSKLFRTYHPSSPKV